MESNTFSGQSVFPFLIGLVEEAMLALGCALGVIILYLWLWWIRKGVYLLQQDQDRVGAWRRDRHLLLLHHCFSYFHKADTKVAMMKRFWQFSKYFCLLFFLLLLLPFLLNSLFAYQIQWQDRLFLLLLIPLMLFDLRYYLIPDPLLYLLLWSGVILALLQLTVVTIESAIFGVILGYLFFEVCYWGGLILSRRVVIGRGDIKLLAALLAWVGVDSFSLLLLLSSLLGLGYGILHHFLYYFILDGREKLKVKMIPFAPALGFSGIILYFNLQIFGR